MARTRNRAKQELAIAELASGATHTAAAATAGVTRQTVAQWAANDPAFQANMEQARWNVRAKYTQALERAADTVIAMLDGDDPALCLAAVKIINERGLGPANALPVVVQVEQPRWQPSPERLEQLKNMPSDQMSELMTYVMAEGPSGA